MRGLPPKQLRPSSERSAICRHGRFFVCLRQNGGTAGSFTNININEDGYVSLNYCNGVSRNYYQVPLATFNAPEQLQRQTGTPSG
jgi:flagellar hook protein FlgE